MTEAFTKINKAYNRTFEANKLTLGLVVPLEEYSVSAVPTMQSQMERVRLADKLGFASVWLRDVPFNVPSFGDAGHVFDPFVYMGLLAGHTKQIALGVSSIVLPLRHPAHVAKAAASVDVLSGGRCLLGVASGDRPEEYPALNIAYDKRGELFRASYDYIRKIGQPNANFINHFGSPDGDLDLLPKPYASQLPMLITGSSQQNRTWLAEHGDGWMVYPRELAVQSQIISAWRERTLSAVGAHKPAMQPLYIDLSSDRQAPPRPIHLGYHTGLDALKDYLYELEAAGINHVAFNLRFNRLPIEETLHALADELLPIFSSSAQRHYETGTPGADMKAYVEPDTSSAQDKENGFTLDPSHEQKREHA